MFRAPEWMRELAAVDVSPGMKFMPVVTQFQLAVEMALQTLHPMDMVTPILALTMSDRGSRSQTRTIGAKRTVQD
ncbi:alpha/beta-hydrolase family protein [uncultured Aliiroseovarius sp.]|uniref:alpha/beta-hydrolase family protein n=1 Tax=uncultured Aliiroseovarius sp. TaxID=1658783 RepID=UPI002602EA86|nr:alpha/beta-hydrolase family protein [uncultured Aliiroseovarius sp.]